MGAGRRRRGRDRLWLWRRDKFWHHLPKMRRTDDVVISLHTIRLATEALCGLLRTTRHLVGYWLTSQRTFSIFIAMKKGSSVFIVLCLFLLYLINLVAVRKLSISSIFSSRQYIPSWISYKREQPSAVPPSLVKSSK